MSMKLKAIQIKAHYGEDGECIRLSPPQDVLIAPWHVTMIHQEYEGPGSVVHLRDGNSVLSTYDMQETANQLGIGE